MLIQMEMEPVSSCHSQRSTKQRSGRGSSSSRGGRDEGVARRGRWGAVVVNGIAKARFIMRLGWLGLAWLGFPGRMGVAVGRLDRAAQIADAYVEYADMSHTHTLSYYTYSAVLAI